MEVQYEVCILLQVLSSDVPVLYTAVKLLYFIFLLIYTIKLQDVLSFPIKLQTIYHPPQPLN